MAEKWRNLTPGAARADDVKRVLGHPRRDAEGVTRGANGGLRLLDYADPQASIFLRDDKVLVIDVLPDGDDYSRSLGEWEKKLGKPPRRLPSIRGKNCRVHVYSEQGLALTVDGGRVKMIEFFEPMGPDAYVERIYIVPPPFLK